MIKTNPTLEVKLGEKIFTLHLPIESTYGEIHDALFQMRTFIVNKIIEANEMSEKHLEKLEEPKDE